MFVDQHLNGAGYADTTSANTQLWRGSELVGENPQQGMGFFTVPPEPAEYRLHADVTRSNSPLSTSISADWEFRSAAPPAGATRQPLRLLAVRYLPQLDDHNQAAGWHTRASACGSRCPMTTVRAGSRPRSPSPATGGPPA
jgi:hypothetical protein